MSLTWRVTLVGLAASELVDKTSCGWNYAWSMCEADWGPICERYKALRQDADWSSSDKVTVDYLDYYCSQGCYEARSHRDCWYASVRGAPFVCEWLSFSPILKKRSPLVEPAQEISHNQTKSPPPEDPQEEAEKVGEQEDEEDYGFFTDPEFIDDSGFPDYETVSGDQQGAVPTGVPSANDSLNPFDDIQKTGIPFPYQDKLINQREPDGRCQGKVFDFFEPFFARQQAMKQPHLMPRAFILNHWKAEKMCHQIGLMTQATCEMTGKPCIWQHNQCQADPLLMLKWYAPEFSELFAIDQFCYLRNTPDECFIHRNFTISDFAIVTDNSWVASMGILVGSCILMISFCFCRLPKVPAVRPRRRIVALLSAGQARAE